MVKRRSIRKISQAFRLPLESVKAAENDEKKGLPQQTLKE